MTIVPQNPYFAKVPLRNPAMFFGRADLLRSVYETVTHRQCVSITGLRGIGKSSFLWYASLPEVQAGFPFDLSHHLFILLDLRNYLSKTSEDFFHNVGRAIIAGGKKHGLILQSDGQGEDEFSSILDQIEEQDFFPVLLLDAFDKVTLNKHFDPEFFEFLRAHASLGKVSYVTASIAPLSEICHSGIAGSPFFNIFYTYLLEALSCVEARDLITVPAQQVGKSFSNPEIDRVLKWAGRHPFFIQCTCYLLWEQKQKLGAINAEQLKRQVYRELAPVFKDIWEQLSEQQQEILQDEARQEERQQRRFPELSESSIFRLFVRTFYQTPFFRSLTASDLEKALEKINDLAALGETNLRFMKKVALNLKNQDAPTTIDKGRAIRDMLNESLHHLRGSGYQSDGARDWKRYNILYYRYFKPQLTNEHIAARLGISTRQYYRERDKAIEALHHTLVQMEASIDD